MDAIYSPDSSWLLDRLKADFPSVDFSEGDTFYWSATKQELYFNSSALNTPEGAMSLMHELGHALLEHHHYRYDIELVALETAAWETALSLAPRYKLALDQSYPQECIDSYRQWLNGRSTCPDCGQTGVQQNKNTYQCINCRCSWRVNEAKLCALRRFKLL